MLGPPHMDKPCWFSLMRAYEICAGMAGMSAAASARPTR